jgi:hypothetical protein
MTTKNAKVKSMGRKATQKSGGRAKAIGEADLHVEQKTFERKLPELLVNAFGQFVVIKAHDILGISDNYSGALRIGYDKLGSATPFFVEQVEDQSTATRRNKFFQAKLEWLK